MRIQLSDPAYTEDLTDFLAGEGCLVERVGEDEVEASVLGSLHHDRLELELGLLLVAWEAGHTNDARAYLVA
jgi:hypothetical protein